MMPILFLLSIIYICVSFSLLVCLSPLRVMPSTSLEMNMLFQQMCQSTWPSSLQVCVCLWLPFKSILLVCYCILGLCVCVSDWTLWPCLCVFVHANIYWQPALITCQSHSSLLQGPVKQKKGRLQWPHVCVSPDSLHLLWSENKQTKKKGIQCWADSSRCRCLITLFSTDTELVIDSVGGVKESRETALFSFYFQLCVDIFLRRNKAKHVIQHKCSPPLLMNKMSLLFYPEFLAASQWMC